MGPGPAVRDGEYPSFTASVFVGMWVSLCVLPMPPYKELYVYSRVRNCSNSASCVDRVLLLEDILSVSDWKPETMMVKRENAEPFIVFFIKAIQVVQSNTLTLFVLLTLWRAANLGATTPYLLVRQSNSKRHRSIEEIIFHMRELTDISVAVGVGLRMTKEWYRLVDANETNAPLKSVKLRLEL